MKHRPRAAIEGPPPGDKAPHDFAPAARLSPACSGAACARWRCSLWRPRPRGSAQGRLEAHYEATLSGLPVGRGVWNIEIADDRYSASASGGTSGILNAIAGGRGTGASQGRVVGGALLPTNYNATTTTSKKSEAIRLVLFNGNIKEFAIEPEPPVDADRIVVTDAHRRGVLDPMTGAIDAAGAGHRQMSVSPIPAAPAPAFSTAACATT